MTKMEQVKLSDIADIIMGQSPKSIFYNLDGDGLPFFQGRAEFGDVYPNVKKWCIKPLKVAKKDDILMTVRAPVGDLNIAKEDCIIGRGLCALRSKLNNGRFLYYLLKGNNSYITSFGSGAVYDAINKEAIENLIFEVPDLQSQQKISSILSAYDDLIENNTRRIQILEEMVQLIYQEWFVNFRFPGHEKVKFVDSELGKIPEGWEVVSLGDICYIEKNKYKDKEHSTLPLLDLARIPRKSLAINSLGCNSELKISKIIFRKGSVLFGTIRPYFHKVFYVFFDGVTNTSVFVIRALEPIPISYLFSLLFSEGSVNWANQNSGGTKMPVISWDVFKTMKIILPDKNILNRYDSIVSSFLDNICILNLKNLKLKITRDFLLPKLIFGELDVSELDIAIRDVNEEK